MRFIQQIRTRLPCSRFSVQTKAPTGRRGDMLLAVTPIAPPRWDNAHLVPSLVMALLYTLTTLGNVQMDFCCSFNVL